MQFDLISFPDLGTLPCATVFDLEIAKRLSANSDDFLDRTDDTELASSAVVYDASENVVKFRFYVNESPSADLIVSAISKTENASLYLPSGQLCAGWKRGFTKPNMWISSLGYETRDGFRGQFRQIEQGFYRADLYGFLTEPTPQPPSKQHWYDPILAIGCVGALFGGCILIWLPFSLCIAALFLSNWHFLLGLLPYVPFLLFINWQQSKLPELWRKAAKEYNEKPPDAIIVLTSLPDNSTISEPKARIKRPGIDEYIGGREKLRSFKNQFPLMPDAEIPPPPFHASKRTGTIMYGLWYGRLTPDEARRQAIEWGFTQEAIEQMLTDATKPPSYWSRRHKNSAS